MWYVYMLRCSDNSLYTGIAKDVERRLKEHNGSRGASYTRGRRSLKLVYKEARPDRSVALRREAEIKRFSKEKKERFVKKADQA